METWFHQQLFLKENINWFKVNSNHFREDHARSDPALGAEGLWYRLKPSFHEAECCFSRWCFCAQHPLTVGFDAASPIIAPKKQTMVPRRSLCVCGHILPTQTSWTFPIRTLPNLISFHRHCGFNAVVCMLSRRKLLFFPLEKKQYSIIIHSLHKCCIKNKSCLQKVFWPSWNWMVVIAFKYSLSFEIQWYSFKEVKNTSIGKKKKKKSIYFCFSDFLPLWKMFSFL